jgi:3-oxoadipate enol-lactonase
MRFRLKSGCALGYRTSGVGDVIVFLHPIGMNSTFWDSLAQDMPNYRALAIDAVGHGESDTSPEEFSLDEMAADTIEVIRSLANGPCIVVGCSMGGMVAQGVTLSAPELVRGLVLLNTSHTMPPPGRAAISQRAADSQKGMPAVLDATIDRWFSAAFRASDPKTVADVRAHLLTCDPIVHARGWRAISQLDYEARLGSIKCAVLVMTGSADVSTPPAVSQALVKLLPNGSYREIAGAGHMSVLEQPRLLAGWINDFAAGLDHAKTP